MKPLRKSKSARKKGLTNRQALLQATRNVKAKYVEKQFPAEPVLKKEVDKERIRLLRQ